MSYYQVGISLGGDCEPRHVLNYYGIKTVKTPLDKMGFTLKTLIQFIKDDAWNTFYNEHYFPDLSNCHLMQENTQRLLSLENKPIATKVVKIDKLSNFLGNSFCVFKYNIFSCHHLPILNPIEHINKFKFNLKQQNYIFLETIKTEESILFIHKHGDFLLSSDTYKWDGYTSFDGLKEGYIELIDLLKKMVFPKPFMLIGAGRFGEYKENWNIKNLTTIQLNPHSYYWFGEADSEWFKILSSLVILGSHTEKNLQQYGFL